MFLQAVILDHSNYLRGHAQYFLLLKLDRSQMQKLLNIYSLQQGYLAGSGFVYSGKTNILKCRTCLHSEYQISSKLSNSQKHKQDSASKNV